MLYVIRHGKTDWNRQRKMQGKTDIPLNEEGRVMAEDAHERYKNVHFDICYCSPLARARETAEILLQGRQVPIIFDDRLEEMGFGVAEGESADQSEGEPIYNFFKHPERYGLELPEGAESFHDLFARTGEFLREVALPQVEAGKDVLIVGHGAMNSSIVCQVWGLPLEEFWSAGIENCVLKRLIPAEKRCSWCNEKNPLYVEYHDNEWGKLRTDDAYLFEMLILESFQAGLSWECVLNKRENFRKAYDGFDIEKVCNYDEEKKAELRSNPGLIRNRLKIDASVGNAKIFREIVNEWGSFYDYLKRFTGPDVIFECGRTTSPVSDQISADLKRRGMKFVGSTIIYSFLQAVGIIYSHEEGCDMWREGL